jgi:tetratricopeptide (TPR) repeat protein
MVKIPANQAPQAVSSGQFLYCKTDTPPSRLNLKRIESEQRPDLAAAFPDLPKGEAFEKALATKVETAPIFSILGFRITQGPVTGVHKAQRLSEAFVTLIDKLINGAPQEGLIGIIDTDTIGWAISDLDAKQAFEAATRLIAGLPDAVSCRLVVGITQFPCLDYSKTDMIQNARKAVDHAAILGNSGIITLDGLTLNVSGDHLFEQNDIAGAMVEYTRGLLLDPKNENLLNSLGVCHGLQQDYDKALEFFEKALSVNPSELMSIYNTGYIHKLQGRYDLGIAAFLKAFNIDPGFFEVAFQSGQTYLLMNQPENAEPFLEKAVSLRPQSNPANRVLGECRIALGKGKSAETALREAIRLSPQDTESLSMLGRLYERENRNLEIAVVFHQQSIAIAPENGRYHLRLAKVLLKLGHFKEALSACNKAQSLGETSTDEVLAEILEKMAESDEKNERELTGLSFKN